MFFFFFNDTATTEIYTLSLHDALPISSVAPTNVFIEGPDKKTREDLLRQVQNGVYIGRIWYTYPINSLRTRDFTATGVGDSYIIQDGQLAAPPHAHFLRTHDQNPQALPTIHG